MRRIAGEDEPPPRTDTASIIRAAFDPLAGKEILDVGCGDGTLARSLTDQGAHVTGVDPNGEALDAARRAVPSGTFHQTGAEAMPFADHSFDGAVFLNSLHHVPKLAMPQALRAAARVIKPAGSIVVVEPLAEGSSFCVLRIVEDETNVRAAAQGVIDKMVKDETFEQLSRTDYLRREYFTDLDEFLARIVAVDPERAAVVEERRSEIEVAFRRYARAAADGRMVLEQPMRAHVLGARR
ncbi:MAG TPA: class I SAM-dependent methyltransferase [Rubrobacteraceae bacterium]|nr:class I SAM-dependent methyltransferase [Rubrobacteraceae bacterium]